MLATTDRTHAVTSRRLPTVPLKRPAVLAWAVPVAACIAHVSVYGASLIDDAFITFAYSKHLAQGVGPVVTVGQRVEATSSMLWAVILAPFEALGIGAPIGSKVVGLVCFVLSALMSARLTSFLSAPFRRATGRTDPAIYSAILVALSSPMALWSFYGMENGLVALLLILSVYLFLREARERSGAASAIPIALLEAARPEGFLFLGVFVLARIAAARLDRQSGRWLFGWFALVVFPVLAYELWGLGYYGHWLPNTVAAKVAGGAWDRGIDGLRYVLLSSARIWSIGLAATILLALIALFRAPVSEGPKLRTMGPWLLMTTLCLAQFAMAIAVGGDWMPGSRFLSHVTPLVACLMVLAAWQLVSEGRGWIRSQARVLGIVAIGCFAFLNVSSTRASLAYVSMLEGAQMRALAGMANYLNRHATREDTVACSDIGQVGYYFKGRVLDWWGLADEIIAHTGQSLGRLRAETVLSRHPRYIVLYSTKEVLDDSALDRNMAIYSRPFWKSHEFRREYRPILSLYFWPDRYHVLFERAESRPG
jgi:hypothetical protein